MSLPDGLKERLAEVLEAPVTEHASVGGGCIAHASRIETEQGSFFLKWGRDDVAATFPAEAAGLQALAEADSPLKIPRVIAQRPVEEDVPGFLVLEWVNAGRKGLSFWEMFGEGLAALHTHTADQYGFECDNFIGRLPQRNDWMEDWPAFFRRCRLEPQVQRARKNGRWQERWDRPLEQLYRRLPDLLPRRPAPSVLHGDLWSGNFMVTAIGTPALVDPATYYGHCETDLAMTELFGGFDAPFYGAYRNAAELEEGYDARRPVYNLYHLINHLNHFGRRYARQVDRVLQSFS